MPEDRVKFIEQWYRNFVSHTNEKDVLVEKIADLADGRNFESCLEIGLGLSPYFAKILAPRFTRYLIVEKRIIKEDMPEGVELANQDWEKVSLDEKFDVIIASHVIYYFQDKKKAIDKMFKYLNTGGAIFFVINGKTGDYGPLKSAFSKMVKEKYKFTYDELLEIIKGRSYREYTVPSTIKFKNFEDLYNTLKISFDAWPKEYKSLKSEMIKYLKSQLKGKKFIIDQKIIEVIKLSE